MHVFKPEKQYLSWLCIVMQDSQTKGIMITGLRARMCVLHYAFHYVLRSLGLCDVCGRSTIVRFETGLSPQRGGYSQRVVSNYGYPRTLIGPTSQLWSFPLRDWKRLLIVNRSVYCVHVSQRQLRRIGDRPARNNPRGISEGYKRRNY